MGKLIHFYDWDISMEWKGSVTGDANGEQIEGKIRIPNFSDEHTDMKDVDIEVSVTSSKTNNASSLNEMLRKGTGAEKLRQLMRSYVDALKNEFSQGLILPAKARQDVFDNSSKVTSQQMKHMSIGSSHSIVRETPTGPLITEISMDETFKCTGQELYNALTKRELLQAFMGGPVDMGCEKDDAKINSNFFMLGGNIQGKWTKLQPFSRIEQDWRLKSWPNKHMSKVSLSIEQGDSSTVLKLAQTGVPIKEVEMVLEGWKRYYWNSIKRTFGYGSHLA